MEGFPCNDGGLMICMALMTELRVTDNDTLYAQPGRTLMQFYDFILPKGKILPAGSCGAVGYTYAEASAQEQRRKQSVRLSR